VYTSEHPYFVTATPANPGYGAAFDRHTHGPRWRPTPADCVNVTRTGVFACTPAQASRSLATGAPGAVAVEGAAPNPVRSRASVRFALPDVGPARLALLDLLGREVALLADGEFAEGEHAVPLEVGALASGLYLVRLTSPYGATVERITIAR
jgi:hypothetical protein